MAGPTTLRGRARAVVTRLGRTYPGTARELCALRFDNPFQLLVATILSAQTTDVRVNTVTPELFARYPTPVALAGAEPAEVERIIHSTGFFRNKAKSIVAMAAGVVERFDGEVPSALEDLVTLPGVGRKTANVVRSVAFDLPGLPVDTHVGRLTRRLGLTTATDPVKVERDVDALVAPGERGTLSLRLILHGRQVCVARVPRCEECVLVDLCPSARVPAGWLRSNSGGRTATSDGRAATARTVPATAGEAPGSPARARRRPATSVLGTSDDH